jgi:phosphoenolpyruvate carboxykinase (ATP)
VNTGWIGGPPGIGQRIKLACTRAIMDAIYSGELQKAPTTTEPIFGLAMVTRCTGVPEAILNPRASWPDPAAYDAAATSLLALFRHNMQNLGTTSSLAG